MEKAHDHRFTAALQREGKKLTLVIGGLIFPENNNASVAIAEKLMQMEEGDTLTVLIRNLYGGDTDEGMGIYHDLKDRKPHIIVDGVSASMGSIIMLAGATIECSAHSKCMTHRPTGGVGGDFEDMRIRADQNENTFKEMAAIYAERTGLTPQQCMELFMPKGKDVWFTSAKMKELGLVDTVTQGSLLRSTVAMKDLRKVREPQEILSRFTACLEEDEVNEQTENTPNMKETAKRLNLPETATEAEINSALDAALTERDTAKAELAKVATNEQARMQAELEQLLEGAVKDNAMLATQRDEILTNAKQDVAMALTMTRTMLKNVKPHTSLTDAVKGAGADTAASKKAAERAAWSYGDWMNKDTKGLAEMRAKDVAAFTKLKGDYIQEVKNKR